LALILFRLPECKSKDFLLTCKLLPMGSWSLIFLPALAALPPVSELSIPAKLEDLDVEDKEPKQIYKQMLL